MDPWDLVEPMDVLSKLPDNFYGELETSKKWLERKAALDSLLQLMGDTPRLDPKANYNELIDTLKRVLEKDSNINVSSTAAKCITGVARGLRSKFSPHAASIVPVVMEKFKEKKPIMREPLVECIDALYESFPSGMGAMDAMGEDVVAALSKPNPQVKSQVDIFIYRAFRTMQQGQVPKKFVKDAMPVLVKHSSDPDPEVRESSCAAMGAIMKCVGSKAMTVFLADLSADRAKMTKIEEFAAKAEQEAAEKQAQMQQQQSETTNPPLSARAGGGENQDTAQPQLASKQAPKAPEMDVWELLEPFDILPKLPSNFKAEVLENKKWLERKAALDVLHQLLTDNPRLEPKAHYGDLVETLRRVLEKDSNINVASMAAKCLTCLAQGLRSKFAQHAPSVAPVVMEKFKEKKPVLRDPLIECLDATYASLPSLEPIADDLIAAMAKPNPSVKIQLDLFLYRAFRRLKPAAVPKKFLKDLIPALAKHCSDPDPEVRDAACSALGAIMKCVGQKAATALFGPEICGDKVKMAKVEEFHSKAVAEAGEEDVSAMVQSIHKPDPPPTKAAPRKIPSPAVDGDEEDEGSASSAQQRSSRPRQKPTKGQMMADDDEDEDESEGQPLKPVKGASARKANVEEGKEDDSSEGQKTDGKAKKSARDRSSSQFKAKPKEPEPVDSLLRLSPGERQSRLRDEKQLKILRWNFDSPTEEHILQLNTFLADVSKPPLTGHLLAKDFKQHLKAIDYLQEQLNVDPQGVVDNVDLLMKWATIRFFDTNPAVLNKLLDFLLSLFTHMDAQGEQLLETEAANFLPYLLMKSGDPKDLVRGNVQRIVRLLGVIATPGKLFPVVLDGIKSKNSRQKAECIAIADAFLDELGVNITPTPQITMKAIAAAISDRDSTVRNAALNAIVTVYKKVGDRIFTLIGQLNEKERAMMDERIRRSGKFVNGAPESDFRSNQNNGGGASGRLNTTISGGTPLRARSSSAQRRPMTMAGPGVPGEAFSGLTETLPKPATAGGGIKVSRRSMGALPNSNSKFQLDAKFFLNDLDGVMAVGNGREDAINNTAGMDLTPIQPVVRPTHRHHHSSHSTTTGGHFTRRSESVSSISSLENAEFIDRTVHNLSCLTLAVADEAIAQLLHLLHDPVNRHYVVERTDLILKTFVTQIFHIRSQHLEQLIESVGSVKRGADGAADGEEDQQPESELSEFMRSVCNFLSTMVKEDAIVQRITADTMRAFIDALLALVSDERLAQVAGSRQIFRSLNVVVIRLCEHSNPNACFVSLMRLLIKYQGSEPEGRIIALIRKCLFKHVDVFLDPAKYEQLDLQQVFDLLHAYYSKFYVDPLPESVKETCRTLNVYIQRLIVTKRYKVLNHMYAYPENCHLVNYVRRCVRALGKSDAAKQQQASSDPNATASNTTTVQSTTQMNVVPDELVELFRRVQEDIFDGCVEEIYNYMDVHPEQNGSFERLMSTCEYSCIVRRAFAELRRQRVKKEPAVGVGDCVRAVLPDEDRQFLERQRAIQKMIGDAIGSGAGKTSALAGK